jgi:hypothetical protein
MDKKLGMPNKTWEEIYDASSVVHFTGSKPTIDCTLDAIKAKKGASDPRFFAIYERYFSLASDTSRKVVPPQLRKSSTFDQAFAAFATTTVTHVD